MYWMFLGWPNASCCRYFAIKRDLRSTSRTIKMNTEVIKNLKKTLTGKASNCTPGSAVVSKPVRLTEALYVTIHFRCFQHKPNYLSKTTKDFNWDLVDSASSHMLVSRTKPCMPQNHCIAGICAWLITSDENCRNYFAVSARLDTLAKCQANTWI